MDFAGRTRSGKIYNNLSLPQFERKPCTNLTAIFLKIPTWTPAQLYSWREYFWRRRKNSTTGYPSWYWELLDAVNGYDCHGYGYDQLVPLNQIFTLEAAPPFTTQIQVCRRPSCPHAYSMPPYYCSRRLHYTILEN